VPDRLLALADEVIECERIVCCSARVAFLGTSRRFAATHDRCAEAITFPDGGVTPWALDVDPGVDQLLHGVSVRPTCPS
jgi:hypothetical protein